VFIHSKITKIKDWASLLALLCAPDSISRHCTFENYISKNKNFQIFLIICSLQKVNEFK
jgi:hypothetical protein